MKTKKKIAIGCGSIVALGILGILGIFTVIKVSQTNYNKVVIPLADELMPVLATWNYEDFKQFVAPKALEQIKEQDIEKLFGMYRRLGSLKEYKTPQFQKVGVTTYNPYGKIIQYTISSEFQNGNAIITLVLVPTKKNEVKVWYMHINSEAFIVPVEEDQLDSDQNKQLTNPSR